MAINDQVRDLKRKGITYKSDDDNDKTSTNKEIYDEILKKNNRWNTGNEEENESEWFSLWF